jgi:hypothetical protein
MLNIVAGTVILKTTVMVVFQSLSATNLRQKEAQKSTSDLKQRRSIYSNATPAFLMITFAWRFEPEPGDPLCGAEPIYPPSQCLTLGGMLELPTAESSDYFCLWVFAVASARQTVECQAPSMLLLVSKIS